MIIDTHAHLYYEEVLSDLDGVLERAQNIGITKIIVPAVDLKTSREIIELSEKHDMIYCAVGIHPCDVKNSKLEDLEEIAELCGHPGVVAIGETGLDYYWDSSNAEAQKEFFKLQIELAKDKELPVVIHTRDSVRDAIRVITENYGSGLKGQFHCFSGDTNDVRNILALDGFYISFCGNVTFKNYKDTDIIKETPVERMLSETDSPFLTPVPNRGKPNEPANVIYTIRKISEIKGVSEEDLTATLYSNAGKLFTKITL